MIYYIIIFWTQHGPVSMGGYFSGKNILMLLLFESNKTLTFRLQATRGNDTGFIVLWIICFFSVWENDFNLSPEVFCRFCKKVSRKQVRVQFWGNSLFMWLEEQAESPNTNVTMLLQGLAEVSTNCRWQHMHLICACVGARLTSLRRLKASVRAMSSMPIPWANSLSRCSRKCWWKESLRMKETEERERKYWCCWLITEKYCISIVSWSKISIG